MEAIAALFGFLFILIAILFGLGVYLLPAIIGFMRKKDNAVPILLLNLFLGWSLIAWVIALVWATSKDASAQQVVIQNHQSSTGASTTESSESTSAEVARNTEQS